MQNAKKPQTLLCSLQIYQLKLINISCLELALKLNVQG
ncbi:hypothetical protein PALB_29060 [Pseudoalteromonas luteoviolacea B = ATCC 29581]|nr:hypothetical protein PALB_29060 [Pseudoalteromonas luteoviolacea B = ATCC 29581]